MILRWLPAVLLLAPCHASAQVEVGGRAVRVASGDTLPLGGAMVVLHRISAARQGPIDSMRTTPDGQFRFRVAADSQALILASTNFSGIEYFSRPARLAPGKGDATLLVVAADTSSGVTLSLAARYLLVGRVGEGGVRTVLDLIVMQNRTELTKVAADSSRPVWSIRVPQGLTRFEVGDGEVSPAAVGLAGDTVTVSAPFSPGERQLVVTYALPSSQRRVEIPFDVRADSIVILTEEGGARVTSPGFTKAADQVMEGKTYRRFVATNREPGMVTLDLPAVGEEGKWIPRLLAAFIGLVLVGATLASLRRRR